MIIIDEQRQAFGYFPAGGALPLTVRGADTWSSADAIAASDGSSTCVVISNGTGLNKGTRS